MNITLAFQIGNTLLSPLYAFLVHRYLKQHITDLHESERKLITDSGLNVTKAVHAAEELGQKSHASAAVLAANLHTEAATLADTQRKLVTQAVADATGELKHIITAVQEDVAKAKTDILVSHVATVDEAKKNNDQALRERLDKPTPQVTCTVCGLNVVRYNAEHVCANCQPKPKKR